MPVPQEEMSPVKLALRPGTCYSNGNFGRHWAVRQIVAISDAGDVSFNVLVGQGRRRTASCSRKEFLDWARYEVMRDENSWVRLTQ